MDDVGFAREVRQKIETMKKRLIVCIFALLIISVNAVAKGNYEAVVAGDNYFVVLKTDGSLWAWGDNRAGQLGDGTKSYRQNPVKVMDDVRQVSVGRQHTMAIRNDGSLWAWGDNGDGQLGDGTQTQRSTPVKIMDDVRQVSAGGLHTMAVRNDGSLWAWGNNTFGEIGNGVEFSQPLSPVKVMDNVREVSADNCYTMAVCNDGSLWAWGSNNYGQYGDGTKRARIRPKKIMDNVREVSAGGFFTFAILNDGSLWAWGNNSSGELGDGTQTQRLSPVKIMDIYLKDNNYGDALKAYLKGIAISEDSSNEPHIARLYKNMSVVYGHFNDYEKAVSLALKGYNKAKERHDTTMMSALLNNISRLYVGLEKPAEARRYYTLLDKLNYAKSPQGKYGRDYTLAMVLRCEGKPEEALKRFHDLAS